MIIFCNGLNGKCQLNRSKYNVIDFAVFLSLGIALLDSSLQIARDAFRPASFAELLAPFLGTFLPICILYTILYLVILHPIIPAAKLDAVQSRAALAVFLAAAYTIYFFHSESDFAILRPNLRIPVLTTFLLLTSLSFAIVGYLLTGLVLRRHKLYCLTVLMVLLAAPIFGEIMLLLYLKADGTSRTAPILSAIALAVTILVMPFTTRRGNFKIARSLIYTLTLLVGFASAYALTAGHKPTSTLPSLRNDHNIKHVILIIVDTLRADAVSCYNNSHDLTPNIDAMARDSIVFKQAFSAGPWTLPSVGSIMTGLSPMVHLATRLPTQLPSACDTLAERLVNNGYHTAAIGDNAILGPISNIDQGFVEYTFYPRKTGTSLFERLVTTICPGILSAQASTEELTNMALSWIDANHNKDFFFWLHYFDPHMEYRPPEQYLPDATPPKRIGNAFADFNAVRTGHFYPNRTERQWIRALYNSEVRYVDDNIGRVLQRLKELGIYDDALIIFTSDHGEEFWEHNGLEHGHTLYNELLAVPLIVKLPGGVLHKIIDEPVTCTSITPTILDLCGIDYQDEHFSAGSLVSFWASPERAPLPQPLVATGLYYYSKRAAVLFDQFKYIRNLETGREELYDIEQDPAELSDISHSTPEKVQQARALLQRHEEQSQKLREYYHITSPQSTELDLETLRHLRGIGYVP